LPSAQYPNNMFSWLVHGPFDLTGASEAWVDLTFRNVSQQDLDKLFWGVSTNGSTYWGYSISGTWTNGPLNNGHHLTRLDLSNVPTLGDLRGEPEVWLAFVFSSNSSTTAQGPFVDDVDVVVERTLAPPSNALYLPLIDVAVTAKTNLYVKNLTGGTITNYTVKNPKLNGAPMPNIVCSNIPAGATMFDCNATFDTGTYQVTTTNTCTPPTTSGSVTFNAGDDVREIRCLGN